MKNPIKEIRKDLEISRNDFATALGVGYDSLYKVEKGIVKKPFKSILEGLVELGYDDEKILKKYKTYYEEKRKKILKSINNKGGESCDSK